DAAGPAGARATPAASRTPPGTRCTVVLWRDAPARPELEAAIARQTQCAIGGIHAAGGRDYEDQRIDWGALANGSDSMVIVAEGWEAPDKALLRLVGDLRHAIGPRLHISVLLVHFSVGVIRPSLACVVRVWIDGLAWLVNPALG